MRFGSKKEWCLTATNCDHVCLGCHTTGTHLVPRLGQNQLRWRQQLSHHRWLRLRVFLPHSFLRMCTDFGSTLSQAISHRISDHNDCVEAASHHHCTVCHLTFALVQGLTSKGWVELCVNGWAWWASHMGVVGVTAGMGIITCILCNVHHLHFHLYCYLTIGPDMWDKHRGNNLCCLSSQSLDRLNGRFTQPKIMRRCNLFTRNCLELWGIHVYYMC